MMAEIHKIVPATLLLENISNELMHKNLVRKMYKQEDIVWQQMKWENFEKLMNSKSLYFKSYGEFSDYDEKKLKNYCHTNAINKACLDKNLSKIERRLFISCWYNSKDLSDVIFKQYAEEGAGIAIGTDIRSLIDCIKGGEGRFFVGNVQYLPQRYLDNEILFEDAQYIAPVFLKGMQFKLDNEFRICVCSKEVKLQQNSEENRRKRDIKINRYKKLLTKLIKFKNFKLNYIRTFDKSMVKILSDNTSTSNTNISVSDLEVLIKHVAIKSDSIFAHLEDREIIEFFEKRFEMILKRTEEISSSGFKVFRVKRIGEK